MNDQRYFAKPGFRIFSLALGLLLVGIGVYAFFAVPQGWAGLLVSLLFVVVGIESIVSAARGTRSWLARIGPLP